MASTLPIDACAQVRELVLAGAQPSDALLWRALKQDEGRAFFSEVVEPLADCFEPQACVTYRELFTRALRLLSIEPDPADADGHLRTFARVRRVHVLSRITLGADVAVTSVVLDAAMQRFPGAEIVFAGPTNNFELFRGRRHLSHLELNYPRRGTLDERLAARPQFEIDKDTIVIDPDSRLTQLGMLPAYPSERYVFFESRSWLAHSDACLTDLAASWTESVLGLRGTAFIAPLRQPDLQCDVAVSFGTGGNDNKRVGDVFERELLHEIAGRGLSIVLDGGAGGPETDRAKALASAVPGIQLYDGPFAPFAALIDASRLYIGYDSAGGHVAAAAGTPAISVFNGYTSERFRQRWRPCGKAAVTVVDARRGDALDEARTAVTNLL